ncbi:MAG: cupin domain-containing protein [Rhizobiales bacterium]|nr:cupin domain-containing protein [Hyphomicrobiales bacterium]
MAKAKAKTAKARSAAKSAARKTSTRKTSSRRKVAARATSARRKSSAKSSVKSAAKSARKVARKVAKPKAARAAAKPKRPPQKVAISHYNNADFESGLRTYAQYRDLGIVEASNGMARAHVLRFVEPCDPDVVSKLHFHDTEFQMVYVLKGWVKTELEGEGEVTMRQGSAWTQPPKIKHKINDYSEDAELLEIVLPADFETVELAG